MDSQELRVLTLNCWGLKYVSNFREERVAAIAAALETFDHDIIALQEIWVKADFQKIAETKRSQLPYAKFFYSGAFGAGLGILSRYPFVSSTCHPYSLNGEPIDVLAGDWFVGKAVVSLVVVHPVLGKLQIFNTHLFAKGGEEGPEHKRAHRLVNAWEFSKAVQLGSQMGHHVLAMGDFNSVPSTLPMKIIHEHTGLADAWGKTHSHSGDTPETRVTTPENALDTYGVSADSPLNSFSEGKPLDAYARKYGGKRLDYILYQSPPSSSLFLNCTQCAVTLKEKIPGHNFSYSDHFAVEATFKFEDSPPQDHSSPLGLSPASIDAMLQAFATCYRFSRHRARRELLIFSLCIAVLVGVVVSSSWLPRSWLNPIYILVTIFVSWLGTTMLYEGLLFGNWESNALMNVIEELEIIRRPSNH